MGQKFEDMDISHLLEKEVKKNGGKNLTISKKGVLDMANNPMISMALTNMPAKYKTLIFLAFIFLIVGAISSVYWVVEAFGWYPKESLLTTAGIIALYVIGRIRKNLKKKKQTQKRK